MHSKTKKAIKVREYYHKLEEFMKQNISIILKSEKK